MTKNGKLVLGRNMAILVAVLGVASLLGVPKVWELVAGGIAMAEDVNRLDRIAEKSNEIHMEQKALNAAQESKLDILTTLMVQQARNGHGSASSVPIADAMNRQIITLAQRIAELNTERADLKAERDRALFRLKTCRETRP